MPVVADVESLERRLSPTGGAAATISVPEAYSYCEALARSHYENFNVGGWITPREKLPHVYAIYAWCRMVDDLGDEAMPDTEDGHRADPGTLDPAIAGHRLARLDWWESELNLAYSGRPRHPVNLALQQTVGEFDIPKTPFLRLIEANRMDQGSGRFESLDDVLEYCDHSANPVGHLYLYLFGYPDAERHALADQTCTALQLTNFWQDVYRDYHDRGRIYLPLRDMADFGVSESDIAAGRASSEFRALLKFECDIAMDMFRAGGRLLDTLDRRARLPVALFTRGGVAVLESIRRQDFDVLSARPALSKKQKAWLLVSAWLGNRLGMGYGLPS